MNIFLLKSSLSLPFSLPLHYLSLQHRQQIILGWDFYSLVEKAQRATVDARLQWLLQYFYGIFNTMETETGIHVAMTQHTNNSAVFDISSFFSFLPRLAATSSSRQPTVFTMISMKFFCRQSSKSSLELRTRGN